MSYDVQSFNTKQALPTGSYEYPYATHNRNRSTQLPPVQAHPPTDFIADIKAVIASMKPPTTEDTNATLQTPEYLDYLWRYKRAQSEAQRQALTLAYQGGL